MEQEVQSVLNSIKLLINTNGTEVLLDQEKMTGFFTEAFKTKNSKLELLKDSIECGIVKEFCCLWEVLDKCKYDRLIQFLCKKMQDDTVVESDIPENKSQKYYDLVLKINEKLSKEMHLSETCKNDLIKMYLYILEQEDCIGDFCLAVPLNEKEESESFIEISEDDEYKILIQKCIDAGIAENFYKMMENETVKSGEVFEDRFDDYICPKIMEIENNKLITDYITKLSMEGYSEEKIRNVIKLFYKGMCELEEQENHYKEKSLLVGVGNIFNMFEGTEINQDVVAINTDYANKVNVKGRTVVNFNVNYKPTNIVNMVNEKKENEKCKRELENFICNRNMITLICDMNSTDEFEIVKHLLQLADKYQATVIALYRTAYSYHDQETMKEITENEKYMNTHVRLAIPFEGNMWSPDYMLCNKNGKMSFTLADLEIPDKNCQPRNEKDDWIDLTRFLDELENYISFDSIGDNAMDEFIDTCEFEYDEEKLDEILGSVKKNHKEQQCIVGVLAPEEHRAGLLNKVRKLHTKEFTVITKYNTSNRCRVITWMY